MRILVVGAGALGGYFGGCLLRAGKDVVFLVRPQRAAQLARDGLRVSGPHGDFVLKAPVVTAGSINGPFDLVLLAVKSYSLGDAVEQLAPAVAPGAAVLPVINGMAHMDLLAARFGADRVLGGLALINATLDPDGKILQLHPIHDLVFGEPTGGSSDRTRAILQLCSGAGFNARASEAIMQEMWEKWAVLAAMAGITCLMRASTGAILSARGGEEMILGMLDECCAVAAAAGFPMRRASADHWRATLTNPDTPLKASMLRDIERGAPTEGEHVLGDMAERAAGFNIKTPLLNIARAHVAAYEISRSQAVT